MSTVQSPTTDDAELARRATAGDGEAFGQLFERWFDRVFDVAWHVVRNRDTAAEVAQDAFTVAWQQIVTLRQPESFGGWLLRIGRNRALDRLRREQRSRPVGDEEVLVVVDGERRSSADPGVAVAEQERDDLVWAASAALGADDASLLGLHLRHGLDPGELASELGVEPNAAHQRLFRLRKRLGDAIGAWTLWERGTPACAALQAQLATAGASRFDRSTSSLIATHAGECDGCRSKRELVLSPEALFAATPLVVAGPALKAEVAGALSSTGVPVADPVADPFSDPVPVPGDGDRPHGSQLGPRLVAAGLVAVAAVAVVLLLVRTTDSAPADDIVESRVGPGSSAGSTSTTTGPDTTPGTSPLATGTTQPPLVEPGAAPATSAPTDPGPTPAPSTTTATTTTTTTSTTAPPPAAPIIGGFRVAPITGSCSGTRVRVQFTWQSTAATSALLGPSGGVAQSVDPNGSLATCAVRSSTWTLQVTGPGGQATAQATVLA